MNFLVTDGLCRVISCYCLVLVTFHALSVRSFDSTNVMYPPPRAGAQILRTAQSFTFRARRGFNHPQVKSPHFRGEETEVQRIGMFLPKSHSLGQSLDCYSGLLALCPREKNEKKRGCGCQFDTTRLQSKQEPRWPVAIREASCILRE